MRNSGTETPRAPACAGARLERRSAFDLAEVEELRVDGVVSEAQDEEAAGAGPLGLGAPVGVVLHVPGRVGERGEGARPCQGALLPQLRPLRLLGLDLLDQRPRA